jgi:hypothetical protein
MMDPCTWEDRVRRAPNHRSLPPELAAHVAGCELCRASLSIAISLREWAAEPIQIRTPGAKFVWLLAQEQQRAQRAARMQLAMFCAALLVVAASGVAAWHWQLLGPGANTGGIATAVVMALLFANWFVSDYSSPIHQ